ncbi:DNA-binding transcriptional LysR family regulator [Hydrogenophaga palleronii]|uniref:DNA-binding transcriptional LysR family regulator n=1 Tax=Hydrogenophaga palleronii TaxID=65655 RepID=A0ABU1WTL0_9BURK|nr:LysR substrate-binding domain-containing protein [Hydrogenophaga palleronii]MDR7152504.1 DNA-binding transcriptional LysR family regulator [Hydrogenophaga palleronii]
MIGLNARVDPVSLRLFVAACDHGTIVAAAERECIAASAISKRIAEMEQWTGTPLLYRSQRGVRPTPAGSALLRHARQILRSLQELQAELVDYREGERGHVRLLVNVSAMAEFVPEIIQDFARAQPGITVSLEERRSAEVVRGIEDGMAEIGISRSFVPTRGLQTFPFRHDHFAVAMDPEHPLAASSEIWFEQTLMFERVGLTMSSNNTPSMQAMMHEHAVSLGRDPACRIQVVSYHAALRLLRGTQSLAILPMEASRGHAQQLGLTLVPLSDAWALQQFVICVRATETLPHAARKLLNHLLDDCPQQPFGGSLALVS